ncbi:MAG: mechanosensitive ion channel [Acidimicrobiia bacterium]|nr:mechanosensitive ion channel [Acidimicrobiia bacterium]
MNLRDALTTAGGVLVGLLLISIAWRILRKRLPNKVADLIDQVLPVLYVAVVVVTALIIIDPDQANTLLDSTLRYLPKALVALIVVIIARALGKITGTLIEAALTRVSPVIAARARMATSSLILAVGVIIALQQIGISTDIILLLVGALCLAGALAAGLAIGLGSVPMAKQVAAGRHVRDRYQEGQTIRVGGSHGRITEIGTATTRLELMDGGHAEVPNALFLDSAVVVDA